MMPQHHRAWALLALAPIGLALAGGGWWLTRKFPDPDAGKQGYFRDWGLTPRGALYGLGMGLMYFGAFFTLGGLILPFLL